MRAPGLSGNGPVRMCLGGNDGHAPIHAFPPPERQLFSVSLRFSRGNGLKHYLLKSYGGIGPMGHRGH
jgi:hypothetical protein